MATPREASAADSAARAETAAQSAADSADQALQAAAQAAVTAALLVELAPIKQALADLHTAIEAINQTDVRQDQDEQADDASVSNLQKLLLSMQSQMLYWMGGIFLLGCVVGYILAVSVFG